EAGVRRVGQREVADMAHRGQSGAFPRALLWRIHRAMVRIRLFEESLVEPLARKEVLCPCHLYSGQEAVAAGLCAALRRGDSVFGSHRSHGHYLALGGDMRALMAEIFGRKTGCSGGRGGSMHVIAPETGMRGSVPIVGGTIALAVGAALAARIRRERSVAVSFFGDGATGEGVFYESLNFAALHHLPVVFACENNLYSTHLPLRECRATDNIWAAGRAFGVRSSWVDGNDAVRVLDAARDAVAHCRHGRGPVLLELRTYRLRGHVGADDNIQGQHTDIRPPAEIAGWRRRDPLTRMERLLLSRRLARSEDLAELRAEVAREVEEAGRFARQSRLPDPAGVVDHVFRS
ncbi:MAG: thiamine pyrophosphate-dependent dehydrogenase E1 component subunit alpha, partial [Myxococcota bacterium]|nr:thiamine pyrophosphate-dependent dehydrogenase E1 component subunit alpha [Myxococcota bacterium]